PSDRRPATIRADMVIAITFAIACVVALIVTPLVRGLAHRWDLLDRPEADERKIHEQPTPRLGGVAMAVGFGVAIGVATIGSPVLSDFGVLRTSHVPAILAGVGLLLVAGLVDDIRGIRAIA